jgi:LmbE family N-acetylglucosaminyl deacetylase
MCLLLVAHPDDDAIFAGELQRRSTHLDWVVVCVTHDAASPRAAEMRAWQATLGTDPARVHFLGHADDPQDWREKRCSLEAAAVAASVQALDIRPDLLVTHNAVGEYGHPHHLLVHRVACELHPEIARLEFGEGTSAGDVVLPCAAKWTAVVDAYASQRSVIATFRREVERFGAVPASAARAWTERPAR